MKTFKTFMAVIAMVLVSGAAKANNTVATNNFGDDDKECVSNCMDNQQDPVVGTYTYSAFVKGTKAHFVIEELHVNADGTYVIQTGSKHTKKILEQGFWQGDGDTYYFYGKGTSYLLTRTFNGLQDNSLNQTWNRVK